MQDELRGDDSESEADLADLDGGPSTSRLQLPSSSRQMRNEAEKKRRDTLNGYITELGKLVPMVDGTPRRVDKISILRLAATYLMQNQILHPREPRATGFLPINLDGYNLSQNMIEDMDAFMLVVTAAGKIVFVSHTVEKLLGHTQIDMFGQSLYNFTLKNDHAMLAHELSADTSGSAIVPADSPAASEDTSDSSEGAESETERTGPPEEVVPPMLQRRSFHIQLSQRSASRAEPAEYKRVHVHGSLRVPQGRQARRHTGEWGTGAVLVAVVRLDRRIRELSLMDTSRDEYVTRHLIDGRIIYSDHRISLVAGYLSEDVSGMSAFKFMHPEDVMFTIVALRQMYDRGEGYGSSCYRLQCATGQFIYLRTHGYLERSDAGEHVESFICVNTLVGREDGERLIADMKARYSACIEANEAAGAIEPPTATVSEPEQLEQAISSLIPLSVDVPRESPLPDAQYWKAVMHSNALPPAAVHRAIAGRTSAGRASVITRRRRHDSLTDQPTSPKRRREASADRDADFPSPAFRDGAEFPSPAFRDGAEFPSPAFRDGAEFPSPAFRDGADLTAAELSLPERAFSRLRSDLQVQNVVITSIQHVMQQVPAEKSRPPILESLEQIKKEHKEHRATLNALSHKLRETLGEGNPTL